MDTSTAISSEPNEQAGLQELLSDLGELFRDTEEYDEDFLKPTQSALLMTRRLLTEASTHIDECFPLGTVYPDGNGGLRIEWIRPKRELRLVVRPNESDRHYIYHEQSGSYGTDYKVSGEKLGYWLCWLEQDGGQ